MRPVRHKEQHELNREWDAIAAVRLHQIVSQKDITYHKVLAPTVFRLLDATTDSSILDVGCGVGYLSGEIARKYDHVTAIDPSRASIELGRQNFSRPNLEFVTATAEDYANDLSRGSLFDSAVANMVLMDVLHLRAFLNAVALLLRPNGRFIFTATHPWFFPLYWKYNDLPWFNYNEEIIIEENFRISSDRDANHMTTHVHRPWHLYFDALKTSGLKLDAFLELYPESSIMRLYPQKWVGPHYIAVRCVRS